MKLVLLLTVFSFSAFANDYDSEFEKARAYTVTSNDAGYYFCTNGNVLIVDNCVKQYSQCIDGYMKRRDSVREGMRLMNAMNFCANSLDLEN